MNLLLREMETIVASELRSMAYGDNFQLGDEFQRLIMAPDTGNSFTALLELPPNQAVELLHCDEHKRHRISSDALQCSGLPAFPSNRDLIERAARYSVFAAEESSSPSPSPEMSNSSAGVMKVKSEPLDSGSNPNSSDPTAGSESEKEKPLKRKEREKKGKCSSKKTKTALNSSSQDGEKLPYVHVRARRGQATDSHSLAERARREKINARMKLLQEIVPGCNKISGTALVLDEIINHVQSLQRQVEYLSMRLATVNPRIDFNLDSMFSGNESVMDCGFPNMTIPVMWPEIQANGDGQQFQPQWSLNKPVWMKDENQHNLVTSDNSLLTYDSSANSGSLHSSQLKMEL